jgi:alcohol dehydrogenase class IV
MAYDADFQFVFAFPTRVVYGAGAVSEAPLECDRLGMKRVMLVSDRVLAEKTDVVAKVRAALGKRVVAEFLDCPPDSSVHAVEAGAAAARAGGAEGVVSVGGGSVIDTAKGICILMSEGGSLLDHVGFQNLSRKAAPHVVLPTTAGTGSEVTYVAVIKDTDAHRKLLFGDYLLLPDSAVLDPGLTVGLPAHLTAATGMDALSHALEALHSSQRQPLADGLALHAIREVRAALPACVATPGDLAARGRMLVASTAAGAAFSNAQVGLVHAMSHTVGARFGVHHGLANSIAMPAVIRFNATACPDVYRQVATAFGVDASGSDEALADRLAAAVFAFAKSLGLPGSFREAGVPREALPELADATLSDGSVLYNPRMVFSADEVLPAWEAAWNGE